MLYWNIVLSPITGVGCSSAQIVFVYQIRTTLPVISSALMGGLQLHKALSKKTGYVLQPQFQRLESVENWAIHMATAHGNWALGVCISGLFGREKMIFSGSKNWEYCSKKSCRPVI